MTRTPPRLPAAALLVLLCLGACGGGGGGTDTPSVTILAAPEYDGVTDSTGLTRFRPEEVMPATGDLEATSGPGYKLRQLFAFHLGTLPAGARVLHAELRLWQATVEGEPYEKNGEVVVDHVDYIPAPGPATYDGQNLTRDIGTLSTSPALGLRTLDVTDAVLADLGIGRPWSQFRLRFYTPIILPYIDHQNDYVRFTAAEGRVPGDLPTLVISYEP